MNRGIIILSLLLYIACFPVISRLVPDASKYWYEYVEYMRIRDLLYEFTLCWLFLLAYRLGDAVIKSVSIGGLVLMLGSLVDKVIFKISDYIPSDGILIILSILLAVRTYRHERT